MSPALRLSNGLDPSKDEQTPRAEKCVGFLGCRFAHQMSRALRATLGLVHDSDRLDRFVRSIF